MSGSGSARQCVGSFSRAEAAALCKARIELEPDGLTHVIVRKVLGKLVETTARAVEHEQAEEHWREAAAAAKEERRQARERQTAAREAREAEAAAAEAKKAEAIVTRCLHREIRLLAEEPPPERSPAPARARAQPPCWSRCALPPSARRAGRSGPWRWRRSTSNQICRLGRSACTRCASPARASSPRSENDGARGGRRRRASDYSGWRRRRAP